MSIRLQMLQVARLAPNVLGESAQTVADYLRSQMNPDGGCKDRAGASDLYYTVFGIEGLFALRADVPLDKLESYLRSFGNGGELDLVHVACLARCWAMLPREKLDDITRDAILAHIESHRSTDGGYHARRDSPAGTIYDCFLATGAYLDLLRQIPNANGIVSCVQSLRATDGGYANQRELPMGLTPSTAAAITLLHHFEQPIDASLGHWLLSRAHAEGGFFATPAAPIPDLLSTATALHALTIIHADISTIREPTLDFIDTLWNSQGAFYGNWEDEMLDCEYTYYGLLALGHLSL
ncbi:MAG TPA: prenyltransferase/squalene oxidase repeat-containing protein [Humisphaera sp.]|nr:prenyltransferase/squalene oxidase repeat-containing protein [Humisphaera sp.]